MGNSKKVLLEAINKGGSSIRDFKNTFGTKGNFQKKFKVYDREGLRCKRFKCKGFNINSKELNIFLNKNINLLIKSKLPFITIEQLKLSDISDPTNQLVNVNVLKELVKRKEYQTVNIDYENEKTAN